jgi:hypothetical protein
MNVGGYFELTNDELTVWENYRFQNNNESKLLLATGSNALHLLLKTLANKNPNKIVFLPDYYCENVVQNLINLGYEPKSYEIDENFNPANIDNVRLINVLAVVVVDYFGISGDKNDSFSKELNSKGISIILDLATVAQTLENRIFAPEIYGAFNSLRKFTNCLDGSEIYCRDVLDWALINKSFSVEREIPIRIDLHNERKSGLINQNTLKLLDKLESKKSSNLDLLKVSDFSNWVYRKTNFESIAEIRRYNFNFMHSLLCDVGLLGYEIRCPEFKLADVIFPMFFPIRLANDVIQLRKYLNSQEIYAPIHWPALHNINLVGWKRGSTIKNMISLPIDQRIDTEQIEKIVESLIKFLRNRI